MYSGIITAAAAVMLASLSAASSPSTSKPVDYANAASWICRPDRETRCTSGLDAMTVHADGSRELQSFHPANDPPVDCFYVYPTTSEEPTDYSDLDVTPQVQTTVRDQAGRLTSRCRVFAPVYRQLTSLGLKHALQADPTGANLNWDGPYRDVLAAWRSYLARDNHGRGVVLIGHSQGTILLQRLIAEEIDRRPVQHRLVAAFLAGDPGLPTPDGQRVGGVFKSIPLCGSSGETGCAYVWADYLDDDATLPHAFGVDAGTGLHAGCVDPAAPAGGSGGLKAYLHRPAFAPESDPPWVELIDQLTVACIDDTHNNVARVTVLPTRYHDLLRSGFERYSRHGGWGLHPLDVELTQGNILDRLEAEITTWTAQRMR